MDLGRSGRGKGGKVRVDPDQPGHGKGGKDGLGGSLSNEAKGHLAYCCMLYGPNSNPDKKAPPALKNRGR